jgi:hypothetical protein
MVVFSVWALGGDGGRERGWGPVWWANRGNAWWCEGDLWWRDGGRGGGREDRVGEVARDVATEEATMAEARESMVGPVDCCMRGGR